MLFAFNVSADAFYNESLFCFGKSAEVDVEILQRFVIGVYVVILAIRFAEQIVCAGIEYIRNFDDLLKRGTRTTDFPATDSGLLHA